MVDKNKEIICTKIITCVDSLRAVIREAGGIDFLSVGYMKEVSLFEFLVDVASMNNIGFVYNGERKDNEENKK